jgi:acyl-CoA thioester hydrolase
LYDDHLKIVTTIQEKPSVRIRFNYSIYNGENKLIHEGETHLAFVDKKSGRPCRPPETFMNVLKPYF